MLRLVLLSGRDGKGVCACRCIRVFEIIIRRKGSARCHRRWFAAVSPVYSKFSRSAAGCGKWNAECPVVAAHLYGECHYRFLLPTYRSAVYRRRIPHSRSIGLSSGYRYFRLVGLVARQRHGELSSRFHRHLFGHEGEVGGQRALAGIEGHGFRRKAQREAAGAVGRLHHPHQVCQLAHFGGHVAEVELHDAVLHCQSEIVAEVCDARGGEQQVVSEVGGVAVRGLRLSRHGEGGGAVRGVHRYGMGVVNRPAVTGIGNRCSREGTGSGAVRAVVQVVVGMGHVVAAVHPHYGQAVARLPGQFAVRVRCAVLVRHAGGGLPSGGGVYGHFSVLFIGKGADRVR